MSALRLTQFEFFETKENVKSKTIYEKRNMVLHYLLQLLCVLCVYGINFVCYPTLFKREREHYQIGISFAYV